MNDSDERMRKSPFQVAVCNCVECKFFFIMMNINGNNKFIFTIVNF